MRRAITAFSNPRIKWLRSLRDKKTRRQEGQFLAEGLRIIAEAVDAGHIPDVIALAAGQQHPPIMAKIEAAVTANGGEVIETSEAILSKISGKSNPQTIVAVFKDIAVSLAELDRETADIWLVAERLRDPGNCGTMLRTGDAVGAGGLILVGDCVDPFSVEAVRASMGAVFTQSVVQSSWDDFLPWLRAGAGELVGTSLNTDADYQAPDYRPPVFLLIGNESQGMPADYETACDQLVRIPMLGRADSLNAAVAAAVMAYEVRNQLRQR